MDLLSSYPEALGFPCDIRETKNVGGLLQHVVAVELRYAERLCGLSETPYESIPNHSTKAIYQVHHRAMELLLPLCQHDDDWWQDVLEFGTRRGGQMKSSRRVIFFHLLLHSIRRYAQLATIVRHHRIDPGWMMDYLDMRLA